MGVEFVMQQILIRGAVLITTAIMKAAGMSQIAINAMVKASGLSAGVGTAGAQGGWVGVLIYMGVVAAAMAAMMAASGGFKEGGYTGNGNPSEVAGAVHRGEFVFPAPAVQKIGVDNLHSMMASANGGGRQGAASVPDINSSTSTTVNIGAFSDPASAKTWLKSKDGHDFFADMMKQHAHQISRRS